MKKIIAAAAAFILGTSAFYSPVFAQDSSEKLTMRRLYNPNSGEHFYTSVEREYSFLLDQGWQDEGYSWYSPASGNNPVYRLYNKNAGDHHYTMNPTEKDYLLSIGWQDEGIGWYSADSANGVPVYREYNPNAQAGAHNYTPDYNEHKQLGALGWKLEDVGWYALPETSALVTANQRENSLDASTLDSYTLPKNMLRKCNQITNGLTSYKARMVSEAEDYQLVLEQRNNKLYEATQFFKSHQTRLSRSDLNNIHYPFSSSMFSIQDCWSALIKPDSSIIALNSPKQNAGLVGQSNPIYMPGWVFETGTRWTFESRSSTQAVIVVERSFPMQLISHIRQRITIDQHFHITRIEETDTVGTISESKVLTFGDYNEQLFEIDAINTFFKDAEEGKIKVNDKAASPTFMLTEKGKSVLS